jgi:hypothetical protein
MRRGDLAMTGFDAIRRHDKALGGKVPLVAGLCSSRAFAHRGPLPVAGTFPSRSRLTRQTKRIAPRT